LVIPTESVTPAEAAVLSDFLERQPPWSDLPVLVLAFPGEAAAAAAAELTSMTLAYGNVTILERPIGIAALLSAVRTAIRARERQYQIRDYLVERLSAEDALRVADQRKDEFIAMLGHELRNPLSPLLNAVRLMRSSGTSPELVERLGPMMERQI